MHCLKILPLSPPSLRCPVIVVRHIGLWFLATPPPRSPFWSFSLAVRRSLRTLRCLAAIAVPAPCAVIVVLVLWLVRETFSGLLLG